MTKPTAKQRSAKARVLAKYPKARICDCRGGITRHIIVGQRTIGTGLGSTADAWQDAARRIGKGRE